MKDELFSNLSLDQLKSREKMLKKSISLIIAAVIVMTIAGIFLTFKQGFSVFTILPLIFFSIILINNTNLKKLRAEIASREK